MNVFQNSLALAAVFLIAATAPALAQEPAAGQPTGLVPPVSSEAEAESAPIRDPAAGTPVSLVPLPGSEAGTDPAPAAAAGPPVNLVPLPRDEPDPAPPAATASDPQPGTLARQRDPAALPTRTGVFPGGVETQMLRAIDPSAIGVLDAGSGGFGLDMWAGTPRPVVERLLAELPVGTESPIMQKLARQLLLSAAHVPDGPAGDRSLLSIRVERLMAAGDVDGVQSLLNLAPGTAIDSELAKAQNRAQLINGDNAGACRTAMQSGTDQFDPFWLKVTAFCRALDGNRMAGLLATGLLRELEHEDLPFDVLLQALGGDEEAQLAELQAPTPLHLAMLRAARRPVPRDVTASSEPGVLSAVASAPNAELDTRLEAARRAEAAGALSTDALAKIYGSIPFGADDIANPTRLVDNQPGPYASALLFQVAQIEAVPIAKAELLRQAWREGRRQGGYLTSVRVNLPATKALKPSAELGWAAADIGRALLIGGEIPLVLDWLDVVRRQAAEQEPEAAKAVLDLWPLVQVADGAETIPWDQSILVKWAEGLADKPEEERNQRVGVLYAIFDALGYPTAGDAWWAFLSNPVAAAGPSHFLLQALDRAATAGRVGETVLLALTMIGDTGPGGTELGALTAAIKALKTIGLDSAARAVALEGLIARGY